MKIDSDSKFTSKSITVEIKYHKEGVIPTPNMTCDFCGGRIEPTFKEIHFILCENCRNNFNSKVMDSMGIMKRSGMGIGMFEKKQFE